MGCAYLLALFLVVGKRQWELQHAGHRSSAEHRPALASYHAEGLDFLFVICALTTVAAYTAYSVIPSTLQMHGGRSFAPTIPFVVLGIARYVRLVYRRGGGGNPTQALLIDDPLLLLDRRGMGPDGGCDHLWPLKSSRASAWRSSPTTRKS